MPKLYGTPGPRAILPSMATSHSVAQCDPLAQLLFDRLIGQADDQGRLLGDPILVKAACMPLIGGATIGQVGRWLAQLEQAELIQRYTAGGYLLIQLTTWWRWQNGQRRVFPSRYPPPDGWSDPSPRGTTAGQSPDNVPQDAGQPPDDSGTDAGQSPPRARVYRASTVPVPLPLPVPVPVNPPALLPVDGSERDSLDTYYELTGTRPWGRRSGEWLHGLEEKHGLVRLEAALRAAAKESSEKVLDRTAATLERAADQRPVASTVPVEEQKAQLRKAAADQRAREEAAEARVAEYRRTHDHNTGVRTDGGIDP